jgi:excisionase family DNA binding protein
MTITKEWYTVEEAAEYLKVSKRTIYKLTDDGRLSTFRIGEKRHRRFRREDLDKVPRPLLQADARPVQALTTKSDPVLAELWDNEEDAIYDQM